MNSEPIQEPTQGNDATQEQSTELNQALPHALDMIMLRGPSSSFQISPQVGIHDHGAIIPFTNENVHLLIKYLKVAANTDSPLELQDEEAPLPAIGFNPKDVDFGAHQSIQQLQEKNPELGSAVFFVTTEGDEEISTESLGTIKPFPQNFTRLIMTYPGSLQGCVEGAQAINDIRLMRNEEKNPIPRVNTLYERLCGALTQGTSNEDIREIFHDYFQQSTSAYVQFTPQFIQNR